MSTMADILYPEPGTVNPEFPFECECGERYRCLDAAKSCRKCRTYLGYSCEVVYDLRILGNVPVWIHPEAAARSAREVMLAEMEADALRCTPLTHSLATELAWWCVHTSCHGGPTLTVCR